MPGTLARLTRLPNRGTHATKQMQCGEVEDGSFIGASTKFSNQWRCFSADLQILVVIFIDVVGSLTFLLAPPKKSGIGLIVDGKPLLDPARFPENVVTLNGRKNIFFRLIIVQNMYLFSLHLLKK